MQIPDLTTHFRQIQIDPWDGIQYNKMRVTPHVAWSGAWKRNRPPVVKYCQYIHYDRIASSRSEYR